MRISGSEPRAPRGEFAVSLAYRGFLRTHYLFAAWAFAFRERVELALGGDGEAHRAWGFRGRGGFAVDLDLDLAVAEGGGVALRVEGADRFAGGQGGTVDEGFAIRVEDAGPDFAGRFDRQRDRGRCPGAGVGGASVYMNRAARFWSRSRHNGRICRFRDTIVGQG